MAKIRKFPAPALAPVTPFDQLPGDVISEMVAALRTALEDQNGIDESKGEPEDIEISAELEKLSVAVKLDPIQLARLPERDRAKLAAQVELETRMAKAVELRLAGRTYIEIARELRCTEGIAYQYVERSIANSNTAEAIDRLRNLENARLDKMQAALWPAVMEGSLDAIDRALKIAEKRIKLNDLNRHTPINLNVNVRAELLNTLEELQRVVLGEVV